MYESKEGFKNSPTSSPPPPFRPGHSLLVLSFLLVGFDGSLEARHLSEMKHRKQQAGKVHLFAAFLFLAFYSFIPSLLSFYSSPPFLPASFLYLLSPNFVDFLHLVPVCPAFPRPFHFLSPLLADSFPACFARQCD